MPGKPSARKSDLLSRVVGYCTAAGAPARARWLCIRVNRKNQTLNGDRRKSRLNPEATSCGRREFAGAASTRTAGSAADAVPHERLRWGRTNEVPQRSNQRKLVSSRPPHASTLRERSHRPFAEPSPQEPTLTPRYPYVAPPARSVARFPRCIGNSPSTPHRSPHARRLRHLDGHLHRGTA